MLYLQLFISFLKIGFFGFGGGYAMLSLIQAEIVVKHGWLTASEFADVVAISQVTPGPISINSATYIGYTTTGSVWGAVLATMGVCAPSLILMLTASFFYTKLRNNIYISTVMRFMRPVVIALILSAALILLNRENFIDYRSYIIFVVSLVAVLKKANPILVVLAAGVAGYFMFI